MSSQPSILPYGFASTCQVLAMTARRDQTGAEALDVTLSSVNGEIIDISLSRPHPMEDALQVFFASRIYVSVDADDQLEFGRFHVEVWIDGAHNEFWADSCILTP